MSEDGCADGEDHGHGSHHERAVADSGEREAVELDEELERNAEECCQEKQVPVFFAEARGAHHRQETEAREEKAVEDHVAYAQFGERDFAPIETGAPEGSGERAGAVSEEGSCRWGACFEFQEHSLPVYRAGKAALATGILTGGFDPAGKVEMDGAGQWWIESKRMLLMTVGAGIMGRMVGVVAALLVACGVANAATKKSEQSAVIAPTVRIPASELGFVAPSSSYLSLRYARTTVDFIDNSHLLFTYHIHRLMKRIPGDAASDSDQTIHAEVVEIATGKVTQQADWRMHDHSQYLWALNDGQFLVREKNSLFLTNSELELRPYLTFDDDLKGIEISPDRKLMLIQIEKVLPPGAAEQSSAPSLASTGVSGSQDGPTASRQKLVELVLVRPGERAVIARSEAKHPVDLPLNDDGFIELQEGGKPNQWVLRKKYFSGEPKEFGMVRSSCMPTLQALSETVVLAVHCAANRTEGNPIVSAVSTRDGTLWTDQWQDKYIWPHFEYATDGSRFVYEALEMNRSVGALDSFGIEDVKGQPVGVFDTESGKLELVENASPVLTGGRNCALSADGRRLAILRQGAIEVYDLPPVQAAAKKDEKKK
jgi:hypothetical protein